jgi:cardiolipin synthase
MKLHRTTGRPDWEDIAPSSRNIWQKLAFASHSYVTPGNLITLIGLGLVAAGLLSLYRGKFWFGLAAITIGRGFDLLDGWAAEYTGTKSPLGEAFDAGADKLGTFMTLLAVGMAQLAPWWLLGILAMPHLLIALIAFRAVRRGRSLHPSLLGKLSMAAAWIAILGLILVQAAGLTADSVAVIVIYGLALASGAMGTYAAARYLRESAK